MIIFFTVIFQPFYQLCISGAMPVGYKPTAVKIQLLVHHFSKYSKLLQERADGGNFRYL
jgi:hypothetical protein